MEFTTNESGLAVPKAPDPTPEVPQPTVDDDWKLVEKFDETGEVFEAVDPQGWWRAFVKFGCVNLHHYHNIPLHQRTGENQNELEDSIHICDIDDAIRRLQNLKALAKKHFGS